jgi:putative PEP-CTERM system histidine kinase
MNTSGSDLIVYGYGITAVVHAAFAAYLLRAERHSMAAALERRVFVAALVATALWAAAEAIEPLSTVATAGYLASACDLLRYGAWFALLLRLLHPVSRLNLRTRTGALAVVCGLAVLFAAALLTGRAIADVQRIDGSMNSLIVALVLAILGALLTEQLFRNLPEDLRWNAKPICLGLAVIFAFDVFMFSEAVLFGRVDDDALAIRGLVHLLSVPLLFVAVTRRGNWVGSLQVSHTAGFYSATLIMSGAYLLFIAAVGYYVRAFGGQWGRALQLGLVFGALLFLLAAAMSHSLRARVRVFINKHFFNYRYDYRQEWLHFTAMLSNPESPQEVGTRIIRGLANMVECPGGALWARSELGGDYRQSSRWNLPEVPELESAQSPFCVYLQQQGWVIDVDEYRNTPRAYAGLSLPLWLLADTNAWLVVPLTVGDDLLGFVTLARPRTSVELNWEVRDLIKTASRQAAGYMAQMQATEALLEARKFDAFNRMSAFVVHDLKNIITQLSLMLKNAERLHTNQEFQQDMLLTVRSSVEKMRRMMLQLREGAAPPGGSSGVELAPIARRLQESAQARGRALEIDVQARLATRGHAERLERVLGHLVQNGLDATTPEQRVWLQIARFGGQIKVEVGDNGVGMTEDFIKSRLFRPFSTTKAAGMGIGAYESAQYISELGGSIEVASKLGGGTVITVVLPLFDSGSDANPASSQRIA